MLLCRIIAVSAMAADKTTAAHDNNGRWLSPFMNVCVAWVTAVWAPEQLSRYLAVPLDPTELICAATVLCNNNTNASC